MAVPRLPKTVRSGWLAGTAVSLVFAALALATLVPIWREPGWPISHEGPAFAQRTQIYARHFSSLDLMPIWSSADAYGFGSPMPLMYHKLFYILAGALALVTGSLKSADLIAVFLLLVVGAVGMFCTMRALGGSRLAATIGGCALITANYTVTNWLVRGAQAEFSAAMLAPWVLLFFVTTIQSGRVSIALGAALGLLWLAHSVLAFYTGLILTVTYLLLAVLRQAPWSALSPRTLWPSLLCFLLIVGPYLVPMAIVGPRYDFSRILTYPFQPVHQFRPAAVYLWEPYWRFGSTAAGLTVQVDHAMLLLVVIGLAALAIRRPSTASRSKNVLQPALPFLIVVLLIAVLQLKVAAPFYEWVPGAAFLQFPWRLLALSTPSLLVAAVYLADQSLPPDGRLFLLGGAAAWMVVGCGAFVPLRDGRIPIVPELDAVSFSGFREYEPRSADPIGEIRVKLLARWTEAGCAHDRLDGTIDEVSSVRFRTSCGRAATLPLPLYRSSLHVVTSSNYPRGEPCLELPGFPSVCGATIPAGDGTVSVRMPTIGSLVGLAWRRLRD